MNSVTCQASGERARSLILGEFGPDERVGRSLRPSWGNHATQARRAGRAHTARAPRQPMPSSFVRGTLTPAASAALMPREVEYMLVIRPARSGNSRLTRPGKSTLPNAIAAPRIAVPRNSVATVPSHRNRMPAARTSRLASSTPSRPNRRATRGATGESRANANSGSVVRRPAAPLEMPVSARIWPIKGATLVSAGRRLAARSRIPNTKRKVRKRGRPDATLVEDFFAICTSPPRSRRQSFRQMLPQGGVELPLEFDSHVGAGVSKECGERRYSFLVEDLTAREAPGNVVGLFLRTHRGRMGRQVTRRRNQHVRACRGVTQTDMLSEGGFDGLYRMEIAILPEEQATHRRQESVVLSSAMEVAGYQLSGLVYPLSLV